MNYWLVKSEPGKWSWDDQVKAKTTHWDGACATRRRPTT